MIEDQKSPPRVGDAIADLVFGGKDGAVRLSDFGGQIVALYFYPKDDTPGCTLQSGEFSHLSPEFRRAGAVVFGVSRDSTASHERFRAKFGYAHDLLSDPDGAVCRYFDVLRPKTMFGKKVVGIERSVFVIDAEGRLAAEWRKVKPEGCAAEVLDFVRARARDRGAD